MQQAILLSPIPSPSVSLVKGRPATTSLEVAKFFGKRHDNVVRDIRQTMDNCPEKFNALNFEAVDYTDEKGETRIMFILFRDGFMLLVMGYTGKKAMQIKIAYIEAFNQMEAKLSTKPAIPATITPSTAADRRPLDKLVKVWAQQSGLIHATAWTQVNAHFNLDSVTQLPIEWIPDAIAFVEEKINALATIEAKPEKALCSVRPDSTIMDDIRAFADEVEQARQKNIEMQQHLFNLISKLMARIGIQYIGKYDTPDAVGFAVNGVYYVRESCRQAVTETHRPMSFCEPAALMAEFAGMIGGEYKKAAKQYTGVM